MRQACSTGAMAEQSPEENIGVSFVAPLQTNKTEAPQSPW